MNTVDVKNNYLINKLVKKHFSLTDKSQQLFTQRLMYERPISKEYQRILKDSKDLRVRFDIEDDILEEIDISWKTFQKQFPNYVKARNLTYSNFRKNKVIINKNEKKILKDIIDFYAKEFEKWFDGTEEYDIKIFMDSNIDNVFQLFYHHDIFSKEFVKKEIDKYYKENNISAHVEFFNNSNTRRKDLWLELAIKRRELLTEDYNFNNHYFCAVTNKSHRISSYVTLENILDSKEKKQQFLKEAKEYMISFISKRLRDTFDTVVRQKIFTNKKLELVFTLNYADWFLCSTGDSWSSCISLYSTYDECFWVGIPNLIGDKTRAMVYITEKNGSKKDFYGIRTDKFMIRSWIQLFRTIPHKYGDKRYEGYNKTFFDLVNPYPIDIKGLENILEKLLDLPKFETIMKKYFSGYPDNKYYKSRSGYVENLWFEADDRGYETFSTIYFDKGSFSLAKKNKAKYFYGDYGYINFDRSGGSVFRFKRNPNNHKDITNFHELISSGISFSEIIEDNSTLREEINRWAKGWTRVDEDYYNDEYEEEYEDEEDYEYMA